MIHKIQDHGRKLAISFSGGETSAKMTHWLLNEGGAKSLGYSEAVVTFANTGEENEKTLEFVKKCDEHFRFNTVWLEAVTHHGERRGSSCKIVDYFTASRNGEPFEEVIKKYGIPNATFKHCTGNLKELPMVYYIRNILRWEKREYDTAIGIRNDEIDRVSNNREKNNLIYPFAFHYPISKPQINSWWDKQEFRLDIRSWEGNCKWCWKKTLRKHYTLLHYTPEVFAFPEQIESEYSMVGPEFRKGELGGEPLPDGYERTFFRGYKKVSDLRTEYVNARINNQFHPFHDESQVFDPKLDIPDGGCNDACEVFGDE